MANQRHVIKHKIKYLSIFWIFVACYDGSKPMFYTLAYEDYLGIKGERYFNGKYDRLYDSEKQWLAALKRAQNKAQS